jgi:4-diphosphocytidyl-2-C-methyl-D-erythritol kinase
VSGARLAATGLALGADLPMCLAGRPLVATGIGEGVAPLDAFPALPLLLVNPGTELATGAVFAALAGKANPALPPPPVAPSVPALASWLEATRNDLEPPAMALAPEVGDVLEALRRAGAAMARMSGSGATCYGLFEDGKARDRAAGRIAAGHPDWFVMATTTGSSSPGRKDR